MTEDIMNQIENAMVLPYADDDPIDEPQEPEYDKYLHAEPEDLNATLRSIARSGSDIEALTKGLQESALGKPQA